MDDGTTSGLGESHMTTSALLSPGLSSCCWRPSPTQYSYSWSQGRGSIL